MLEIQQEHQKIIIKFLLSIASRFRNKSSPPYSGLSKDPTNRYIKTPKTNLKHLCTKRVRACGENLLAKFPRATRCLSKSLFNTCRNIRRYYKCRPLVSKPFALTQHYPTMIHVILKYTRTDDTNKMVENKYKNKNGLYTPTESLMDFTCMLLALKEILSKPFPTINDYTNLPSFKIKLNHQL